MINTKSLNKNKSLSYQTLSRAIIALLGLSLVLPILKYYPIFLMIAIISALFALLALPKPDRAKPIIMGIILLLIFNRFPPSLFPYFHRHLSFGPSLLFSLFWLAIYFILVYTIILKLIRYLPKNKDR